MINKDIQEMQRQRDNGATYKEIGKNFEVSPATVHYHLNESTRIRRKQKSVEAFKRKSKEERKRIYKRKLPKVLEWQNRKYKEDEDYREMKKKYAREYYRKNAKHNKNSKRNNQSR